MLILAIFWKFELVELWRLPEGEKKSTARIEDTWILMISRIQ